MRVRFEVSLDTSNEINFKVLKSELLKEVPAPAEDGPNEEDAGEMPSTPPIVPARPSRAKFNIIEHLEQRYGKGGYLDMKDSVIRRNVDHDDLYDSDDSFIDDSDLHESIESTYSKTQVKTKHSGFFVNAGDRIETVKEPKATPAAALRDELEKDNEPLRKKTKKNAEEMDDWGDEWQPGAEVEAAVANFREFCTSFFAEHGVTKAWPPALDDKFREVDKIVVDAHPQRWRVNGYITNLMLFLPYTKTTLRGHMVRLEARDHARQAKQDADEHYTAMETLVGPHTKRANESDVMSVEGFKEDVLKDVALAAATFMAVSKMEEWVAKENEYRQLLKQEDKKHLDEVDTVVLSLQKERNRLYTKGGSFYTGLSGAQIVGLFPASSVDAAFVRDLVKIGRKETGHTNTPHVTPVTKKAGATGGGTGAAKKVVKAPKQSKIDSDKSPDATPKVPTASVKRPPKPLKSRRFEVCPTYNLQDFYDKPIIQPNP
ncbi:hypothetical protein ACHHYP_09866 [Achlya hypogyna]|uniref:Hpc2-related domain-containing protein n=1 Tax=Achlya hypogyna TaxID=1202772 RepID=A0A1V9ZIS2_ACHHY|nr:hypothetical protein ACHHYP_09866 [Achlya hypogyna]